MLDQVQRDVQSLRLPRWGRVVAANGVVPWLVLDPDGGPVEAIVRFLREFVARGNRAASVRSYAYALLRWWRFLRAVEVEWDRATSTEVRDFVLWLQATTKPGRRTVSAATAGTINPVTRKKHLDDRYQVRTLRHSNAVLRTFYEYWIELGHPPLINPVPLDRCRGGRPGAHHNPLEPYRPEGKLRYNPKVPKRRPRAMPDERWNELFSAMRSNRDRAILALAVSTGARASELLGVGPADVDWGDQLIRVRRKGSDAQQWLPASPEAFVWLRLYFAEVDDPPAGTTIWMTLRRRRREGRDELAWRPLNYDALRAVLRRANALLGSNWSMHDLRHTAAVRMTRDESLSMRDVQTILGHAHLATTQVYTEDDDEAVIRRVRRHLAERASQNPQAPIVAEGYDPAALAVLFGEVAR
jgi:integrase/recombinase XerD